MNFKNIRHAVYWGLDYLSGSPVRCHLNNIRLVSKDESLLSEHQAKQIKSLLSHAVQTTDYYKNYDSSGMLKTFPVVNKNIIRESFAQFQSSIFKGKKLKVMETSGSTGTPFRVVQNSSKRQRVLAELIEFNALVGYYIGTRYVFIVSANPIHRDNMLGLFLKNKVEFRTQNIGFLFCRATAPDAS